MASFFDFLSLYLTNLTKLTVHGCCTQQPLLLPTYSLSVVAVVTALLMCNEYQDGFVCYIVWKMAYKSIQVA